MTDPLSDLPPGLKRQMEIYQAGLAGKTPGQAVSLEQLDEQAKSVLTTPAYDYLAGGAGSEDTVRANREAFRRWRIIPRLLRDVARRDLSVNVLGLRLPVPFMLAPVGVLSILHKEADLAVARAARSLSVPLVLSTASSSTMEDVAGVMSEVPHWFQLYWPKDNELAASLVPARSRPAMARSSLHLTPACSAGASATSRTAIFPSSSATDWPITSAIPYFSSGSAATRGQTRCGRSSTSCASFPTRLIPGRISGGCASRPGYPSSSRAYCIPTTPQGRRPRSCGCRRFQPWRPPVGRCHRRTRCAAEGGRGGRRPLHGSVRQRHQARLRRLEGDRPRRALRLPGPALLLWTGLGWRTGRARGAHEPDRRPRPHARPGRLYFIRGG